MAGIAKSKWGTHPVRCTNGPFWGALLYLGLDEATAQISIRGQVGRYIHGRWTPAITHGSNHGSTVQSE